MPRPSTIARWKAEGRCPNCGRVPAAPYRICAVCREGRRVASARLRRERLAADRCPRCGEGMVAWGDGR